MKYAGGCHCGKVRYEVELKLDQALACNCSICSKRGHLLAFAPDENFKLLSGENSLSDYQFAKKKIHHLFCSNCGVASFGTGTGPDGKKMRSINIRCLDDVELEKLQVHNYDGKSL